MPKSWETIREFVDKDIRDRFEEPLFDSVDKEMRIRAYWIENAPLVASILQLARNLSKLK